MPILAVKSLPVLEKCEEKPLNNLIENNFSQGDESSVEISEESDSAESEHQELVWGNDFP